MVYIVSVSLVKIKTLTVGNEFKLRPDPPHSYSVHLPYRLWVHSVLSPGDGVSPGISWRLVSCQCRSQDWLGYVIIPVPSEYWLDLLPRLSFTLGHWVGSVRLMKPVSWLYRIGSAFWRSPDGSSVEYISLSKFLSANI